MVFCLMFLMDICYLIFKCSIKEINRLISKEISNIYSKVTTEKNRRSQNYDFLISKNLSLVQESSNAHRYHSISKLFAAI